MDIEEEWESIEEERTVATPTLSAHAEPARVARRDYLFCAVCSVM